MRRNLPMTHERDEALVLVADDNPTNLDFLSRALADEDFDIAVATDGEGALRLAGLDEPDLILLDVMMPGIDGFETCRRLKANPATMDTPVIFMTSLDDTEHRIKGYQVGAVDYITKPFQGEELLARIRPQLAIRRMTRTLQEKNARLQEQILERERAEAAREALTDELLRRTEELREAKERLERELVERERAEAAREALQEEIITFQRQRLIELSTPLIPITSRILVMPLVGTMDMERAERATETALRGASERRAAFVILDVTGVAEIDAEVAGMLARAGEGLRLLGARAVITGMSPAVARALVTLDISFGALVTRATLQDGIAYAMRPDRAAKLGG